MRAPLKYEALVSASSSDEAIAIASEAIPAERQIVRSEAEDVSAVEGANSYRVTLWFEGGKARAGEGELGG